MRFRSRNHHMIDFLFPIALLFVFAISGLTIILLGANIYRSASRQSSLNYTAGTFLSYIAEKIHQSDDNGNVFSGTFAGRDALILKQEYNGTIYVTYIYIDGNVLKELYVKDGTRVNASFGRPVLKVKSFKMDIVNEHAFRFTCVDEEDQKASSIVSVKSTP